MSSTERKKGLKLTAKDREKAWAAENVGWGASFDLVAEVKGSGGVLAGKVKNG